MSKPINPLFRKAIDKMIAISTYSQSDVDYVLNLNRINEQQGLSLFVVPTATSESRSAAIKDAVAKVIMTMPDKSNVFSEDNREFATSHGIDPEDFSWFQLNPEGDSLDDFTGILIENTILQIE